jgi:hypothetical protein
MEVRRAAAKPHVTRRQVPQAERAALEALRKRLTEVCAM